MKGLRSNILDFEIIQTGNPKTLVFVDASDYLGEPERPLLEVTLPGYNKYFLVNVAARTVNTFNSNTIGIEDALGIEGLVDLPDGVYQYRYKICPYTSAYIDKAYLRTTLIEHELGHLYDKIDSTPCSKKTDKEIQDKLVEIHVLLEGAKLLANHNMKKASDKYHLAARLLDKLFEKINKSCC